MSKLTVYASSEPTTPIAILEDAAAIQERLNLVGVTFERWQADKAIAKDDTQDDILNAYKSSIDKLKEEGGYQTADVISLNPSHPDKDALRQKFLNEHTHSEDEVRFFVRGQGLFCLHIDGHIYATLCQQGDLISVPAGVTHWFDMGSEPEFTCIRLFTNPEGWVAQFTGSDIAAKTPNMDAA
ncbi:MAG: cupin domain-containing protein [Pseudomonadota bacterium]|nr:cupin domain-containing protein [Pseudomonadota bacterium]